MPMLRDFTLDYIMLRCDVDEDTQCWTWRNDAKSSRRIHPQVHLAEAQRPVLVRRLVYEVMKGGTGLREVIREHARRVRRRKLYAAKARAEGREVRKQKPWKRSTSKEVSHYVIPNPKMRCSSEGCVNPTHMLLMSQKQKVRYSLSKANADKTKKSISNAKARRKYAKLTMEVVQEIRLLPMSGPDKVTDTALTRMLRERGIDVCRKAVSEARRGNTWRAYGSVFGGLLPTRSGA